jgi:predicted transcriptional regulator of viral defense system
MSKINDNIKPLSEKEVRIIAELEFNKKSYFTRKDIKHHFDSNSKLSYTIHRLISKNRIIKLNRDKYYLIPIKAKTGKWTDNSFIIADEMFNGKDYYIGGWTAANYHRLTDQIPMKIEVFTNKRNGIKKILTTTFIFKKTTQKRIDNSVIEKVRDHEFKILGKKETKEWLKSRNY